MENQRIIAAGTNGQSHVHCPYCDTLIFSAIEVIDMNYKCVKCHRRYLINVKDGSVSIVLTRKPEINKND